MDSSPYGIKCAKLKSDETIQFTEEKSK
ncbi:hypothetical protein DFR42_105377, partial [Undibacterium pigrum]